MALFLTFVSGLFFLVGIILFKFIKKHNNITIASMATASIILIGLIIFDIIPEILEQKNIYLWLFVIFGLLILILVDKLIPHHNHDHHENDEESKEHQDHLLHISIITMVALILHNMIEGMALYGVSINDLKNGILMTIGIGLHNLPFGFQIAGYDTNGKNKILVILLVLSGLLGGIIIYLFGSINTTFEGIIIALTLGMLLHILVFEFLKEVLNNIKQKATIYGIIIGIILLVIINLI